MQKRIKDYAIKIGSLKSGQLNKITDVPGVTVGHRTLQQGSKQTGVTAILPSEDNIFENKMIAATHIINGFGKTSGTIQINELGTLETPIVLTNTLNVGIAHQALVKYSLKHNPTIGQSTGTVNPIIGECNDMVVNDIRSLHISEADVFMALENTQQNFLEGAIGAGRGMKAFGLKGGIGSSSRLLTYAHGSYTVGVTVLANFGSLENFRLNGKHLGPLIKTQLQEKPNNIEKGSIMIILATDLPVSSRQLKRIISRASVGLARTGAYFGNGSGDIVIGFSTANRIPHNTDGLLNFQTIPEADIDQAFIASADATEEAILNALLTSEATMTREGSRLHSLKEFTKLF